MKKLLLLFLLITVPSLAYGEGKTIMMQYGGPNLTGIVSDLVPATNDTYDLGSSLFKWKDLFLSGTMFLGDNLGLGQTTFGTSAAKVFAQAEGTKPTTSPADAYQLVAQNINGVAGKEWPHILGEDLTYGPIAIQNDVAASVNTKMPSQAVHMTAASSGSSGIAVADNDNIDFGTGDFSVYIEAALPDWTPSAAAIIAQKSDGTNGWKLQISTTGLIQLVIDSKATYSSTVAPTITDGTRAFIGVSVTRETASAAGSILFTVNKSLVGSAVAITAAAPTTVSNAASLYVMGTSAVRTAGRVSAFYPYNRALTAAEVESLYKNGPSFADKWESQTAVLDDDAADDDTGDWSKTDCTLTFDTDHYELNYSAATQWIDQSNILQVGKRYRLSVEVKDGTSSSEVFYARTSIASGSNILAGTTGAVWATLSGTFVVPDSSNDNVFLGADLTSGNIEIRNISITQIGATLALPPENIQTDKWYDASTNGLDASYPAAGASLVRPVMKSVKQGTITTGGAGAVTVTSAMLLGGIITADPGSALAYTFETGATSETASPMWLVGDAYEWSLVNINGTNAVTVTASSGHTIVGNAVVALSTSAKFKTVKTAASTFVSYRIN